jgi:hypothetical protein
LTKDRIEDLIAAVEAVEFLKVAAADQKQAISAILDELNRLRERVVLLEMETSTRRKS